MGFSFCVRSGSIMIKTLFAIGLVAAVKAQYDGLDPITQGLDPITQGLGPITQGQGPVLQGLGPIVQGQGPIIQGYGKRSADAFYGYPYAAYGVGFGSSTGLDPITQGLDASTQGFAPYAHYGYGVAGHYLGKRSADADPFFAHGYPYAVAGVPFGSSTGLDPITQGLDASTQGFAPYAHYGYGVAGHYLG